MPPPVTVTPSLGRQGLTGTGLELTCSPNCFAAAFFVMTALGSQGRYNEADVLLLKVIGIVLKTQRTRCGINIAGLPERKAYHLCL